MATDNLNIHKQINSLLRQRTQTLAVHGDLLRDQAATAASMQAALEGVDPESVADRYTSVLEALSEVSESARNSGRAMEEGMEHGAAAASRTHGVFGTLASSIATIIKLPFKMGWAITKFVGGLSVKSVTLLWNTFKGMLGVMKQIVMSAANIGKALTAYVFDVLQRVIDISDTLARKWYEIFKVFESAVRAPFGDYAEDVAKAIRTSTKQMSQLSDIQKQFGLSMYSVFRDVGEATSWVAEQFQALGSVGSLLGNEIADMGMDFVTFTKGMGLSGEQLRALGERAVSTGKSFRSVLSDMANMSLQLSEDFKFSGKLISKTMGDMVADVSHFGNLSMKRLGEVAIRARSLGLEIESLGKVIDKHLSFDDAVESAAKMAQAFGANFDAIKLMNEASQGGMGVIEEYRRGLFAAGKSAEKMSLVQLRLLAQNTGLSEAEARIAFSMKNRGKSMEEIAKSAEFASKKELTQAEATQKLADATERYIRFIEMQGGMFERFVQGFGRGILMSNKFIKSMLNVRKVSETVEAAGRALGVAFFDSFKPASELLQALDNMYDVKKYRALTSSIKTTITSFFEELSDPAKAYNAVRHLLDNVKNAFWKFWTPVDSEGKDVLGFGDVIRNAFPAMYTAIAGALPYLHDQIVNVLNNLTSVIKGEIDLGDLFPFFRDGDSNALGIGQMMLAIKDLVFESLRDMWEKKEIQKALTNLFDAISDALDNLATDAARPRSESSKALHKAFLGMMWSGVKLLGRSIKPVFGFLWENVVKVGWTMLMTKLKTLAKEKFESLQSDVKKGMSDAMSGIVGAIKDKVDNIKKSGIFGVLKQLGEAFKKAYQTITGEEDQAAKRRNSIGEEAFLKGQRAYAEARDRVNQLQSSNINPKLSIPDANIVANVNQRTANGLGLDEQAKIDLGPLNLHLRLQVNLDANRIANVLINETRVVGSEP